MAYQFRKHRFDKSRRLKTPAQFKLVYDNKQWGNTRLLTFNAMYDPSLGDGISRLGVTVSKKVSKLAVRRNQLKRLVREFYRHHHQELEKTNLVVTVKPAAKRVSNAEFNKDLLELWEKLMKWQRWHTRKLNSVDR